MISGVLFWNDNLLAVPGIELMSIWNGMLMVAEPENTRTQISACPSSSSTLTVVSVNPTTTPIVISSSETYLYYHAHIAAVG